MAKRRYWLSFDLGLQGQYDELYAWLDRLGARECGDAVATFRSDKSRDELTAELKKGFEPQEKPQGLYRLDGGR